MRPEAFDLPLRIVVEAPVPGVAMALQRGASAKATLIGPVQASADALIFDFDVTVEGAAAEGGPRLLGPFVQGPPGGRFVYTNAGTYAGQPASIWQRRAKVPLAGLTWPLIEALAPGGRLEAGIAGAGRDGGPACASVALSPLGCVRTGDIEDTRSGTSRTLVRSGRIGRGRARCRGGRCL